MKNLCKIFGCILKDIYFGNFSYSMATRGKLDHRKNVHSGANFYTYNSEILIENLNNRNYASSFHLKLKLNLILTMHS